MHNFIAQRATRRPGLLFTLGLLSVALLCGCSSVVPSGPQQFTCSASDTSCDYTCSGSDNCQASCQNPNGGCNLTCTGSSTCSCTGDVCSISCETSRTCTCSAGGCNCSAANCQHWGRPDAADEPPVSRRARHARATRCRLCTLPGISRSSCSRS